MLKNFVWQRLLLKTPQELLKTPQKLRTPQGLLEDS
jgi:hypothetical protein